MCTLKKIFLFFGVTMAVSGYTQNPNPTLEVAKMNFQEKQVVPPSPEAAELGKYGNIPVSLFTGTPSVSVPLHELKGSYVSLPVSLSFNASGFKPTDQAPWVGSGWSLNAGGVITRSVIGNPDTYDNYFGVDSATTPPSIANLFAYYEYMQDLQNGFKEAQPDVYYYNFGPHKGKFYLKPDETVFKKEKDLRLITPGNNLESFTIIDEQGVTYFFDQLETTTMTPNDDEGTPLGWSYTFTSSWYLTHIISADGTDVIEFEYHTSSVPHYVYQSMLNNRSVSLTYGVAGSGGTCGGATFQGNNTNFTPPSVSIVRKFPKKIKLKKYVDEIAYIEIESATGRLDSINAGDRQVNNVKVYSKNNGASTLVKQFDFYYGYYNNAYNVIYKNRLRLDSLKQVAVDGGTTASPPPYKFTYNTSFDLPERFNAALDHWGYYNAANSNTSLVPYVQVPAMIIGGYSFPITDVGDGANREPTLAGSEATMINKIEYPTGGYTTFEYELNKAKFDDSTLHDVGGVRLKRMIDYSFVSKEAVVKDYSYLRDDGITTSGLAGSFPDYRQNSTYQKEQIGGLCPSAYELYTVAVGANSIFGLGSFNGGHMGYSQVTETQTNLANYQPVGKTVYRYKVKTFGEFDDDIANGDLLQKTTYRNDGKILQDEISVYEYTDGNFLTGLASKADPIQSDRKKFCLLSGGSYLNFGEWETPDPSCLAIATYSTRLYLKSYQLTQQNKQLKEQIIKLYDQTSDNYLTTVKKFVYDNAAHNYPTKIKERTINADEVVTEIKYAVDYAAAPSASPGSIAYNINTLHSENITGAVIEKVQYRQDTTGGNKRYLSGTITDYLFNNPHRIYFLEVQPPLTSLTMSSISSNVFNYNGNYRLAATMDFDNLHNLNQQTKTDDVPVSYIWDYHQSYPISTAKGAPATAVCYTSFESDGKGGFTFSGTPSAGTCPTGKYYYTLTSNSISGPASPSEDYIVSYWRNSSGGPYSVTGSTSYKQGVTKNGWTLYEHIVTGNSSVTISGTGNIDEVRLYPATAQLATQTFDPQIGITSQCDANNRIVYYNYDGLNRLVHIKDADGYIVKNFRYNYGLGTAPVLSATSLFYNAAKDSAFGKTGCTGGSVPDTVIYKISYGKYAATTQYSADSLALADIIANGQNYANATALCQWRSVEKWAWFFREGCTTEQGLPVGIKYIVPAGRYRSTVSQSAADALAQADVDANGQAYANANGTCACSVLGPQWKVIDDVCEEGEVFWTSSVYNPATGLYTCYFRYQWSDNSQSAEYYTTSSTQCPEND